MSSLMERRLQVFKAHRRGWISLWMLLTLFVTVLFAEVFFNDVPYIVWTSDRFYVPLLKAYKDNELGGSLETPADFKDADVMAFVQQKNGWVVWPPVRYGPASVDERVAAPSPPSWEHWMGTDASGRDVLARLVYGLRTSLLFGCLLACVSVCLGLLLGGVQGYLGGLTDLMGQRLTELWSSFPKLFALMVLSSFVTPHLWWLLLLMSLFSWMGLASLVRAEFLRVRTYDYVVAAHVLGVPSFRVMWRHVLPNALVGTLTYFPFLLNHGISVLTALDFLGFGLPLGTPSLGDLLHQAKNNLYAPWLGFVAFGGISTVLVLIAFVGEALRDAMATHQLDNNQLAVTGA